jgi:hypothetical protein
MSAIVQPQWIARMFPKTGGQDHLGIGSVSSDQILPTLTPGINVLTVHPRYHSFYVFLLDEFWQRDLPRTREAWVAFFRPRDFAYALAANLCDQPEHHDLGAIVGSQTISSIAHDRRASYRPDPHYIKQPLGGFGLYYRSVMAELGLIYPGGPGFPYGVDIPTETHGKSLAEDFREATRETTYYRDYFNDGDAQIPLDVLVELGRKGCLCQLERGETPDRSRLMDLFVSSGPGAPARKRTIQLFLDIAANTDDIPVVEDTFRQLIYFGSAGNGAQYAPQSHIESVYSKWRIFQAREYYAFSLNALWSYACHWGLQNRGEVEPLSISDLNRSLESSLRFDELAQRLHLPYSHLTPESSISDLMSWIRLTVGAEGSDFDAACTLQSPLQEHRLYQLALSSQTDPIVMVAGMLVELSLIYLRFSDPELRFREEWGIARMGGEFRLSLESFLNRTRAFLTSSTSLAEWLRWLCEHYVINQHLMIANTKWPNNTFRFERTGDQLRFHNLPTPLRFNDSRYDAIATTVHELGLCGDLHAPSHSLTHDGYELLHSGASA